MHPIIHFYLEQQRCDQGFSLHELWNLPRSVIGDGYFYITWLFPVTEKSKWNHRIPFTEADCEIFRQNAEIQAKFLTSFDKIIDYFGVVRVEQALYIKPEVQQRAYWLRNVGHESKKMTRIMRSLHLCGQPELAEKLQQLAIQLGTEKGHLLPNTLEVWQHCLA